jgi:hypothetical protein
MRRRVNSAWIDRPMAAWKRFSRVARDMPSRAATAATGGFRQGESCSVRSISPAAASSLTSTSVERRATTPAGGTTTPCGTAACPGASIIIMRSRRAAAW